MNGQIESPLDGQLKYHIMQLTVEIFYLIGGSYGRENNRKTAKSKDQGSP